MSAPAALDDLFVRLSQVLKAADEAVAALRTLVAIESKSGVETAPPAHATAPAPAAPARTRHVRVHEDRPTAGVCEYTSCGAPISIKGTGRLRRYCGPRCARLARLAVAPPSAPADASALPVLADPEPIPESASGMKARIAHAIAASRTGPLRPSHFLDTVRGRMEQSAKRNGGRA